MLGSQVLLAQAAPWELDTYAHKWRVGKRRVRSSRPAQKDPTRRLSMRF